MLGTLIYASLDIGLNIFLWTSKVTINGVIYVYNYAYNRYEKYNEENQKILMIESKERINKEYMNEIKEELKELKQLIVTNDSNANENIISNNIERPPSYNDIYHKKIE